MADSTNREHPGGSPIAIVGMACRFPGGPDLSAFWHWLESGGYAVTQGRPDGLTLTAESAESAAWGAYLTALDRFDAEFFRIAPVEAELLDPQQRLLLETSWEALEDAGLDPGELRGSRTSAYAGLWRNDYRSVASFERDPAGAFYLTTGTSFSTAIGRVAYTLGLEGPAIAVDTACSSSLVAIHQAAAGLQRGEADLALAGGVNAVVTVEFTRQLAAVGMLAPDGRCRTFDAAAKGFVRGEGCGMLVLKRLADAERDGDRIQGVLLGSAVNQDGASAGLTAPNGPAQERVITEALARAGVAPAEVDYLEAHGTGTELGDPIEVQAAAAAYGKGRPSDRPLLLGSVKTNIGHLEAAAGVAGVIKVLLSMRAGVIPKHLHFERPNPRMDWERLPVRVTSAATAWPSQADRPMRAGVSSFGFSGTNAHVILESYGPCGDDSGRPVEVRSAGGSAGGTPADDASLADRTVRLLPLSARSGEALRQLAGRWVSWLEARSGALTPGLLSDAAWTAGVGRSHFGRRAGLVFEDGAGLRAQLEALGAGEGRSGGGSPGKVAFLFTGQGSQWAGMGRDLYEREPVARAVLDRCEEVFREERGSSLLAVMFGAASSGGAPGDSPGDLDATAWTQPALYALEAALAAQWSSVGVAPDVVLGHSVGEIAAARAAGAIGLEAGLRFASRRGMLMGSLPRTGASAGGMAAVFASSERVRAAVEESNAGVEGAGLCVAADNGAHQVVSGPLGLLSALEARLRHEGVRAERLATSHAFHSGLMDPVLAEIEAAARDLAASGPSLPLVSNVTGGVVAGPALREGGYWRRQARSPVAFGAGVRTLAALGVGVVVEVGPRAVLGPMAGRCWPASGAEADASKPVVLSSLDGPAERGPGFVHAVAKAWEANLGVKLAGLFAGERRRRVALPTYPFQRRRYWVKATPRASGEYRPADFLAEPGTVASRTRAVAEHLREEGIEAEQVDALAGGLDELSRSYALAVLEELGWKRRAGAVVEPETLRRELRILDRHGRFLAQMLAMLGAAGILRRENDAGTRWVVASDSREALPAGLEDAERLALKLAERHPYGKVEIGLLRRGGAGLGAVLRGHADALELLFRGEPSAVDVYHVSPCYRAVNRLVAEAVSVSVSGLPAGRRLRVLEVGAGTGGTTAAVLAELPEGRTGYTYTDISAGFFATAEARFGDAGADMDYRVLDIEREPSAQGFDAHGHDIVLAANVLHATRDLGETLRHCRRLLAPSGMLVLLETHAVRGWPDFPFGVLPGWWRFDDAYRSGHPLVGPQVWRRALSDAGYEAVECPDPGPGANGAVVILGRAPAEVRPAPGPRVLRGAGDADRAGADLAREPEDPGRTVVMTNGVEEGPPPTADRMDREVVTARTGDLPSRLRKAVAGEREGLLVEFLRAEVQSVLRLASPPPAEVGFLELGLDSLMAIELRDRLNRAFGGEYEAPSTLAFDYPNVVRLARHLVAQVSGSPQTAEVPKPRRTVQSGEDRIAVVGMACRFPAAPDLSAFWKQLESGADAVTKGRPGGLKVDPETDEAAPWGGYVEGMDRFDAEFFRIAPAEAELLDPQQRLLLQTSWEALENAGMAPDGLKGSRTGVYCGITTGDYERLIDGEDPSIHAAAGISFAVAIGRVAYTLGLEGPAIAMNTACSSSLVAVHQAVAGLQRGDADLVLAGGVNAVLTVDVTRQLDTGGMLSPDGRCRTFDAAAKGFVRGEGCGMLVLKRLADAERDGDRIQGVLLGSAVNQDGASAGLTAPNGPAQERVIAEALARAGVAPAEVDYLEAHGTGTELGDPIEVQAAAAAYGKGRPADRPLLLGSVKTNIGHLEAAAGVAGVIKVLLSMRAGVIPKHLHFERPNPRMDWARLPVRVTSSATAWPSPGDRPMRAGVSSFGFSGTNAHVILESYGPCGDDSGRPVEVRSAGGSAGGTPADDASLADRTVRLLPLSARSGEALRQLAGRWVSWLEARSGALTPALLSDAAWTAGVGRSHFGRRAGLVFEDGAGLRAQLEALAAGEGRSGGGSPGKVAFLFTGQGSQWAGMGRDLYEREPVARAVLDRCEEVFREERGSSLLAVMFGAASPGDAPGDSPGDLDATAWTQPALYALEAALAAQWSSVGVVPDVVLGHSVGEIAAARVAGAIGLEAGLRFASRRGMLMGSLPRAEELAVLDGVEEAAALFGGELSVPLVSGMTGGVVDGPALQEGGYWRRQARSPVAFGAGVRTLAGLGVGVVVEIGPRAALGPMASSHWPASGGSSSGPTVLSSQRGPGCGGQTAFAGVVSAAYEAGLGVRFAGLFAGERRRRVALPTYPFQQRRYWVSPPRHRRPRARHPLLGERHRSARGETTFETELHPSDQAWLKDHRLHGSRMAPAALFAAQAVSASMQESAPGVPLVVDDLQIYDALVLPEVRNDGSAREPGRTVQVVVGAPATPSVASRPIAVFSRGPSDSAWIRHAEACVRSGTELPPASATVESSSPVDVLTPADALSLYDRLAESGIVYGWSFRCLSNLRLASEEAMAEVSLQAAMADGGIEAHPVLIEACTQVAAAAAGDFMPLVLAGWDRLWLREALPGRVVCHVRLHPRLETGGASGQETRSGDMRLYAPSGLELGGVRDISLRRPVAPPP